MTWTLVIPRALPSANERHVNGRDPVARAMYRRLRNAWVSDLMAHSGTLFQVEAVPLATGRRRVVLTRVMGKGQRPYDIDSLPGGCKLVLDAMKPAKAARQTVWKSGPRKGRIRLVAPVPGAGLIVDDSPRWVEVEYRQARGERAETRITIEEVT